jgi:arylsulfatase A-like enzyme
VVGDRLLVVGTPDGARPAELRLRAFVDRGEAENGAWRVSVGRWTGDGIPVWTGERVELVRDLPAASALRVATLARALAPAGEPAGAEAIFRVRVDGELVLEARQPLGAEPLCVQRVAPLPYRRRAGARITLEVDGAPSVAAFLDPRIGPREIGGYRERPWGTDRPDLVVFLADTFRADNIAAYGSERDITPHLDALAQRSRVFRRAWSPSSWTLPSHASLFSGLHPHQHGATEQVSRAPLALEMLAERLAAAGYRTGAVTDGGYLAPGTGLAQGFEWFVAHPDTLEDTLASVEAFLDADDGRPLFLFVQTYRTHTPYVVSEETRRAFGERFDFAADPEAVRKELFHLEDGEIGERWGPEGPPPGFPEPEPLRAHHHLYLGTVIDLDRGFARFQDALAKRGLDATSHLVFTSDHGEAFGEHREVGHGNGVWEEHVRVPLLLSGPGIAPGVEERSASLVDLPRTLCALAGVPPSDAWGGRSLLVLPEDRPVFAFECNNHGESSSTALIAGARKVIVPSSAGALEPGAIEHAYDLGADPAESRDLAAAEPWPAELLLRLAPAARVLFRPLVGSARAPITPERVRELERLGYIEVRTEDDPPRGD